MAVWTDIPPTATDTDSPVTAGLMGALAENPSALAEGAAGAPKIETAALDNQVVTTAKLQDGGVINSKIAAGTIASDRLLGDAAMANFVAGRLAAATLNTIGQIIFAHSGAAATYAFGDTVAGSSLFYSDSSGGTGASVQTGGTYRCLGAVTVAGAATLWIRIA